MTTCACGSVAIAMAFCLMTGAILTGVFVHQNKDEKTKHSSQYSRAVGLITNVELNPDTCYEERGCRDCAGGTGYPACRIMIDNNQTGRCAGSKQRCCTQQCWRRECRNGHCTDLVCMFSFEFCTRCTCINWNINPLCEVVSGTCYRPAVTVLFTDDDGNRVETSATKHCKIGEAECANAFVEGRSVGDSAEVYYLRTDSREIVLDSRPAYKMSSGIIVGFVLAGIMFAIAIICIMGLAYMWSTNAEKHFGNLFDGQHLSTSTVV